MGTEPPNRALWRVLAVIVFVFWMAAFALNVHLYHDSAAKYHWLAGGLSLPVFAALGIATLIGLTALVIDPVNFLVWGALSGFWGLRQLWDGGDIPGFTLYCLSLAFAYKRGLFKTFPKVKTVIAIILPLAAIGSQFRYGIHLPLITLIRCLFFVLAGGIGAVLLAPAKSLRFLAGLTGKPPVSSDAPAQASGDAGNNTPSLLQRLNTREQAIIRGIQEGKRYKQIAFEMNMSEASLKRQLKEVFKKTGVSSRAMFLNRYGEKPE